MRLPLPMTSLIASMTDGRAEARFNGSRRCRGLFAAATLLGCALAVSGCQDEIQVRVSTVIAKAGQTQNGYSKAAAAKEINTVTRALELYCDRVGPVIAENLYLQNYLFESLGLLDPKEFVDRINGYLEDDDKVVEQLMIVLGTPRVGYHGDSTFLGQWGLKQTDAMLEAYIRSQLSDVKNKEPSAEARAWLERVYGTAIRRYIHDDELLRMMGFDNVPVTPGLGS